MKKNTDHVIEYADFGAIKINCTTRSRTHTHARKQYRGLNFNKRYVRPKLRKLNNKNFGREKKDFGIFVNENCAADSVIKSCGSITDSSIEFIEALWEIKFSFPFNNFYTVQPAVHPLRISIRENSIWRDFFPLSSISTSKSSTLQRAKIADNQVRKSLPSQKVN